MLSGVTVKDGGRQMRTPGKSTGDILKFHL